MKTLAEWIARHQWVIASLFERNYNKQTGSGKYEDICGFCLASYRFRGKPPILCRFCNAPMRETRSISDLPEILDQQWKLVDTATRPSTIKAPGLKSSGSARSFPSRSWRKPAEGIATLSPYEDKCWVFAFNYYLDRGKTEPQADKLAWRDLQLEFPRLRGYEGVTSRGHRKSG